MLDCTWNIKTLIKTTAYNTPVDLWLWKSETPSKYMQSIIMLYVHGAHKWRVVRVVYTCSPIGWRVSRDYLKQDVLHTEYSVSYIEVSL